MLSTILDWDAIYDEPFLKEEESVSSIRQSMLRCVEHLSNRYADTDEDFATRCKLHNTLNSLNRAVEAIVRAQTDQPDHPTREALANVSESVLEAMECDPSEVPSPTLRNRNTAKQDHDLSPPFVSQHGSHEVAKDIGMDIEDADQERYDEESAKMETQVNRIEALVAFALGRGEIAKYVSSASQPKVVKRRRKRNSVSTDTSTRNGACLPCQKQKVKCDGASSGRWPCMSCTSRTRAGECLRPVE